jgi:restriction system protein
MLPLLQVLSDGKEWFHRDLVVKVAENMSLTVAQREKPSSKIGKTKLSYNLEWAETNLFKANLIMKPQKTCYRITEEGKAILRKKPERIDARFLMKHSSAYVQWRSQWKNAQTNEVESNGIENTPELINKPPEELLEDVCSILRSDLAQELLDAIKKNSAVFFERLVVKLLEKMGYGNFRPDAGKVIGRSGDKGIDGIINEDKLGLDVVCLQAKKYDDGNSVSSQSVQAFIGALVGKAKKGVFITTSSFTSSAKEEAAKSIDPKIILIDGQQLAKYMIEYNVGVTLKETYEVKRIDYDYFDENEL